MKHLLFLFLTIGVWTGILPVTGFAHPQHSAMMIAVNAQKVTPRLGLLIKKADAATLKKLKLKAGVEVVHVRPNSPAQKAGIQVHDIIVKFNGDAIHSPQDLQRSLQAIDEQKPVDVVVNREGKELILTATVQPDDRDSDDENEAYGFRWPGQIFGQLPDSLPDYIFQMLPYWRQFNEKGGYLGVVAEDLTDQLLRYFRAENGVLVKKVLKNSPAEKAGLKAGDVIYKINDKKIEDTADLMRTIQFYDPGNTVTIYFVRNGKKKTLKVTLGRKPKQEGWHSVFPQFWFSPDRFPRRFQKPFLPPRFEQIPQERSRGIYKF